jgi:hypothetical protein
VYSARISHGRDSERTAGERLQISFWTFIQVTDRKVTAEVRLAIVRADSGRRYFFRAVTVNLKNDPEATVFCVRLYDCVFPENGIYFVELWYDNEWLIDQRLEIV